MRMSFILPVAAALAVVAVGAPSPVGATEIKEAIKLCQKNPQCSMHGVGNGVNIKVGTNEVWCPKEGPCECIMCSPPKQRTGSSSTGTFGGGVLTQSPSKANPRSVLTSTSGGAGSWTTSGGVFVPKSAGAVQKTKPHSQPKQTPTAEPKPAPTTEPKPTPTAEPKSTPPVTPPRIARDHRVTPKVGDDRSSAGVTKTRPSYDGAQKASGSGPSASRQPKINDHRGVDPASREAADERRKPKVIDHRSSNPPRKTSASSASTCGTPGNPFCQRQ